jgi:hypothetical protein
LRGITILSYLFSLLFEMNMAVIKKWVYGRYGL